VKRGRKRARQEDAETLTLADVGRLVGIGLILLFFLLLASVPQIVFRWSQRDGYRATEAEILSPSGRQRSIRVRVKATGEELSVWRSSFDGAVQNAVLPVWYNPTARLKIVFTVFDERVVSATRHPSPAPGAEAFGGIVVTLVAGIAGAYLVLRGLPA
jgi:hypothetical protein